jgi:phage gp36-like protein
MYCTLQHLIDEFGETELIQLTDRSNAGLVDQDVLDRALQRADRTINRYLGGRSELPVGTDEVVDLACDITRYYLYTSAPPDAVRMRFEDAIRQLEKLAKGVLAVVDTAGAAAAPAGDAAQMVSGGHVFGRADDSFI